MSDFPPGGYGGPEGDPFDGFDPDDLPFDPDDLPFNEGSDDREHITTISFLPILEMLDGVDLPAGLFRDSKHFADRAMLVSSMLQKLDTDGIREAIGIAGGYSLMNEQEKGFLQETRQRGKRPGFRFKVEDPDAFVAELMHKSDKPRKPWESAENGWGISQPIEPYEHACLKGFHIHMDADPETYNARLYFGIDYRSSGLGTDIRSLMRLAFVRDYIKDFTFYDEGDGKPYIPDNGGMGLFYEIEDMGSIKIEMDARGISVRSEMKPKFTEDATDEEKHKFLQDAVEIQLMLASDELPRLFTGVSDILGDTLPVFELMPRVNAPDKTDEWLRQINRGEKDEAEVPSILKEDRHITIYRDTVQPKSEVTFDMVGGLDDARTKLRRAIRKATKAEDYQKAGLNPKATVLLAGPPGCGKTMLAQAIANEVDGVFLSAKGSDILSMWAGEAEKNVSGLFQVIELLGREHKVVLLLDEVENLAPSRTGSHMMEHERKVTAEFLSALNFHYPNAIIIAATNDVSHVDPALVRSQRVNTVIEIPLPDKPGREQIFGNWVKHFGDKAEMPLFADDLDIQELARTSDTFSGADIQTIIEEAVSIAVDEAVENSEPYQPVTQKSLLKTIHDLRKQQEVRATGQYL